MLNFIKSIIIPSKMRRFRYMSVLIALLIFVSSIYVVTIPHNVYINTHKDKFINENSYVSFYQELEEITLADDFKSMNYKVVDNKMTSTSNDSEVKVFKYNTDTLVKGEEKNINLYMVFDIKSSLLTKTDNIKEQYNKAYPDSSYQQSISYLIYIDSLEVSDQSLLNDDWYKERFDYYHGLSKDQMNEIYQSKNNFDLYGIKPSGDNNYLIIFLQDQLISQIPYKESEDSDVTYPALTTYYSSCDEINFTTALTLKDFGNSLTNGVFKALKSTEKTRYLLTSLIYVIIFPALYCLLLFWCMHKRGTLKTYKEYYNVASIASILPLIITFIAGWFIPNAVMVYGIGFSVMTLVTFYKINLTPDQGI